MKTMPYDDIKIVASEATHRALDPQDLIPGDLFFVLVREDWRARDTIRRTGPMQSGTSTPSGSWTPRRASGSTSSSVRSTGG